MNSERSGRPLSVDEIRTYLNIEDSIVNTLQIDGTFIETTLEDKVRVSNATTSGEPGQQKSVTGEGYLFIKDGVRYFVTNVNGQLVVSKLVENK